MSPERRVDWKKTARNIGLAALVGIPMLNYRSSTRVISSLQGKEVNCSSGEAMDSAYPFGLIAVPGAGIYIDEFDNPYINATDIGRLTAAAQAYVEGYAPKILLLNGKHNSSPQIAIDYLKAEILRLSKGKIVPDDSVVVVDNTSINTATNMRALSDFHSENRDEEVLLVTNKSHSRRVALLACNYGINSEVMTVEELTSYNGSADSVLIQSKETIEVVALMYDPKGVLPTGAKSVVNFLKELSESFEETLESQTSPQTHLPPLPLRSPLHPGTPQFSSLPLETLSVR